MPLEEVNADPATVPYSSVEDEEIVEGEENASCWTRFTMPQYAFHRYIALALMCFMGFGSYFVYDIPAALETHIMRDMSVTTREYASLYSWYSWPNVILSFIGGLLVDRVFGIRLGAIIFSCFIVAGQIVLAFGAFINNFTIMQLGRFVFGIGGESLGVTQSTYAVSWFKGKELNMVFGFQLSFARVGSTASFNTVEYIYDYVSDVVKGHTCLGIVFLLSAVTCVFSFISAVILAILDKRAERILNKQSTQTGEVIKITDTLKFPLTFWMICFVCVTYYTSVFPFVGLSTVLFIRKYGFSVHAADVLAGMIYLFSAVASPIFGIVVDKTGRNLVWVLVSVLLTLMGHVILSFTLLNPWYPICIMGMGYSILACALWPMVSLVIPEYQLGTAYGVMQSLQNFGMAVGPLIAGTLVDFKGYVVLELFFFSCLCGCTIIVIMLFAVDVSKKSGLNYSSATRIRKKALKKAMEADDVADDVAIIR